MQSLPAKHAIWRRYPETKAEKLTVELRIFIVTGIVFICWAMHSVGRKILCGRLIIEPVKWGN